MARLKLERNPSDFVDTPKGIFTAAGIWFHTTESLLRAYAGAVLEHVALHRLLMHAVLWLRSPDLLAIWTAPVLLAVLDPVPAVLAVVTVYVGWQVVGPSFTSLAAVAVFRVLDQTWLQVAYYIVALTLLAATGSYAPMWIGLGLFILVRWGLLARLTAPLVTRLQARLYPLPVADQVLRGFLIRVALKHRLTLSHLDNIERQIIANASRRSR